MQYRCEVLHVSFVCKGKAVLENKRYGFVCLVSDVIFRVFFIIEYSFIIKYFYFYCSYWMLYHKIHPISLCFVCFMSDDSNREG